MQISSELYSSISTAFPGATARAQADEVTREPKPDPVDRVEISGSALQASASEIVAQTSKTVETSECAECAAGICTTCGDKGGSADDPDELTEAEQEQVRELKARDTEVRAHEAAHAATGGQHAGSPSYEYQVGPDGKRYAIGGEVSIDASIVKDDPAATIEKMRQVQAAALAPAEPSGQDRKVAQQAVAKMRQAQADLAAEARENFEETRGGGETGPAAASGPADAKGAEGTGERDGDHESGHDHAARQALNAYEKIASLVTA